MRVQEKIFQCYMTKIYHPGTNMLQLVNGRTMNGPRREWAKDCELFSEEEIKMSNNA